MKNFWNAKCNFSINKDSRLGATYTLNYKKYPDYSHVVQDLTGGVDLILDPIGA